MTCLFEALTQTAVGHGDEKQHGFVGDLHVSHVETRLPQEIHADQLQLLHVINRPRLLQFMFINVNALKIRFKTRKSLVS